ncbi:MAG: ribosome assembly RNA-binding protein YhbY [Clostridia bacterium]|nr:ribosome assembly RNA-binding protein YhbY [Clostridia bacterium]
MLNSKQRAQLRGMANSLQPIFQIGKGGIGEQLIRQVNEALEARELIKLTVLETSPVKVRECADTVAEATESDVVQVIGSKFILYKESKENKQIVLVKKK